MVFKNRLLSTGNPNYVSLEEARTVHTKDKSREAGLVLPLRQQIVIVIITLHRCRPLLLTKHGPPHECLMALVRAVLLFPLYSRGHGASGRSPGQGTELELGLKPFDLLNLCGLVNAACLVQGGRRRGSTRDWGPVLQVQEGFCLLLVSLR